MIRRVTFLVLALTALFVLQFADCLSPLSADQQTMQCCGSMPCNPTNHSHDCCKLMVSSQSPSVLPAAHITLHAPVMVVTNIAVSSQSMPYAEISRLDFAAPQHSPPELYTLNSSFLI